MKLPLELVPFLIGASFPWLTSTGRRAEIAAVAVGVMWAGIAGEFRHGPAEACLAVMVDSAAALAGVLVSRLLQKRMA